jgi:2-oxoglutarate ferredoxin oxidoreductase subunit delta
MPEEAVEATAKPAAAKRRKRQGIVTLFPNWCKGCGLCVEFCPKGVLEQTEGGRVLVARPEECSGCHWCELHCPDFAIFVTEVTSEGAE